MAKAQELDSSVAEQFCGTKFSGWTISELTRNDARLCGSSKRFMNKKRVPNVNIRIAQAIARRNMPVSPANGTGQGFRWKR